MISSNLSNRESNEHTPLSLKLKMSQFYLFLSFWYGNMQELPVMFPHPEDYIAKESTIPSYNIPKYGSSEWMDYIMRSE